MKADLTLAGVVLIGSVLLGGCATTPTASGTENNGRISLANSHIGESYDAVITRASNGYKAEPQCESRKVSMKRQRKAFLYDICGYNPEGKQFTNAPLAEVVYHFIERKLVRVDVRALGEQALLDDVKEDIESVFKASSLNDNASRDANNFEWIAKQHVAGLRAGAGGTAGNVHVRLLDESLLDSAPWLAEQ